MTEENIVQENLQMETISSDNLKDRLETLVEEINKKDNEHVIALVHPKLPNSCLQISTKLKRPKKVTVTPHQKKTFCSPRQGRCPHCRKRADVSKLPTNNNRLTCKHKKCGISTAVKKWLCIYCSQNRHTDIEFDSCYCYAKALLNKGNTILMCPEKCKGWKRLKDVTYTKMLCQMCGHWNRIRKWRCYKCKESSYECTCKKPDS